MDMTAGRQRLVRLWKILTSWARLQAQMSGADPSKVKWGFPELGVPPNGWSIRENPIKMDDLGVPPFQETSKFWRHTEKIAKVTMLIATKKYSRLPDTYSLESLQLLALWQCSSRAQSPGFLIRKPTAQTKITEMKKLQNRQSRRAVNAWTFLTVS